MRLRLVVEMKKTSMTCLAVIVMAVVGLVAITPLAPAQSVSGSFNPQTQFPAGAGLKTTSIYAVATAPLAIQNATSIPTQGNHTFWHYNQTRGRDPVTAIIVTGTKPLVNCSPDRLLLTTLGEAWGLVDHSSSEPSVLSQSF